MIIVMQTSYILNSENDEEDFCQAKDIVLF